MTLLRHSLTLVSSILGGLLVSASPLLAAPPTVPANFNTASPVVGAVQITWNDTRTELSYELGWGPGAITTTVILGADVSLHTISPLSPVVSYQFRIRACNAEGCSPYTIVLGRVPDGSTGLPPLPNNFVLSSPVPGTVMATWDDTSNEASYEVGWGVLFISESLSLPANQTYVILTGLQPGSLYQFRIRSCNAAGCTPWSSIVARIANGSDGCALRQTASYSNGMATFSVVGGAGIATTWRVWLVGDFGVLPILSLEAGLPVASGDFTFALSRFGTVGFLTALTTQRNGLLCTDFDTVNTGVGGTSAPRVRELIEELQTQLREGAAPQ